MNFFLNKYSKILNTKGIFIYIFKSCHSYTTHRQWQFAGQQGGLVTKTLVAKADRYLALTPGPT